MKHCKACNIDVNTTRKTCPLCHDFLEKNEEEINHQCYPKFINEVQSQNLPVKIPLFVSIIAIIMCVIANIYTFKTHSTYWSIIVIASIISIWILVFNTILSKKNIAFKMFLEGLSIIILVASIELAIDYSKLWSVIYVMPVLVSLILTSMVILGIIIRKTYFLFYIIGVALVGLIPFIVVTVMKLTPKWLALGCLAYCLIVLLAIIFFCGKALKDEIAKTMHL